MKVIHRFSLQGIGEVIEVRYNCISWFQEWIAGFFLAIFFMNQIGRKGDAVVEDHFPSLSNNQRG